MSDKQPCPFCDGDACDGWNCGLPTPQPDATQDAVTSAEINALPDRVREYIHALETECDPAGTIRENFRLSEENAGLRRECENLASPFRYRMQVEFALTDIAANSDDPIAVAAACRALGHSEVDIAPLTEAANQKRAALSKHEAEDECEELPTKLMRIADGALEFPDDEAVVRDAADEIVRLRLALSQHGDATGASVRQLVDEQAKDERLWFQAETCGEAYVQNALRRLHAAVEGDTSVIFPAVAIPRPIPKPDPVAAEREACAKIADVAADEAATRADQHRSDGFYDSCVSASGCSAEATRIAAAIRSRSAPAKTQEGDA